MEASCKFVRRVGFMLDPIPRIIERLAERNLNQMRFDAEICVGRSILVIPPAPPATSRDHLKPLKLSTALMAVHKDCYAPVALIQGGARRGETARTLLDTAPYLRRPPSVDGYVSISSRGRQPTNSNPDSSSAITAWRARNAGRSMQIHDGSATAADKTRENTTSQTTSISGRNSRRLCVIGQPKM